MVPFHVERLSSQQAYARLGQIEARLDRDHSTNGRMVYWAPRQSSWVTAEREGSGIVLSYFKTCPCGG